MTTGGGYDWPRFRPGDTTSITEVAYLHNGDVFFAEWDPSDGLFFIHQLTHDGQGGAASWSPDGTQLAYIDGTTSSGILFIARLGASHPAAALGLVGTPRAVAHLGRSATAVKPRAVQFSPLREATAVAWSPDSHFIAFPGGECLGIYDDCLSVVDLRTNTEVGVRAFGGDGTPQSGFATTPAWTADGGHLLFTDQEQDPLSGLIGPPHILSVAWPLTAVAPTQVGQDGDVVPAPSAAGGGTLLVTAGHNGQSWVTRIGSGGARTFLYQGFHQDWQSATA